MRILIISERGEGLPIALHSMRQWTEVIMYIKNGSVGTGLVEMTTNPVLEARNADVAIITSSNMTDFHKQISKWCPTIGGSQLEYQLNNDQGLCQDLFKLGGGSVLKEPPKEYDEFLIGAWHGRGGWKLPGVLGTVNKGLFNKGKGAMVDGVGVTVTSDYSRKIFNKILKPFSQTLVRGQYNGFVVVKVAFDGQNMTPISVSAGLDSYLIPAMREITKSSLPATFQAVISTHKNNSNILPNFGMAVMMSVPPFPYKADFVDPTPIENHNKKNAKHLWLLDVNKHNGMIKCAGASGAIGYATAFGKTVKETRRRVYRTIDRLAIPTVQYRNDIGEDFTHLLGRLGKMIQ